MSSFDPKTLDLILSLQLTVGWAGEKAESPQRLAWWDTDLTDAMAGGDLFARLLPKTAPWAGLELAREAAIRSDRLARAKMAHPDQVWTLFHFGFELDEALQDRFAYHKRHSDSPTAAFGNAWGIADAYDREAFEKFLTSQGRPTVDDTPAGRRLKSSPTEPLDAAKALAAALLPLSEHYPVPHSAKPGDAS